MFIKRISVSNFKSFKHLDVELDNLNVLIGANAAGKSNFLAILMFLRDIARHGLQDAISMQGGVEYLLNTKLGISEPLSVTVVFAPPKDDREGFGLGWFDGEADSSLNIKVEHYEVIYDFAIAFTEESFTILQDKMTEKFAVTELMLLDMQAEDNDKIFKVSEKGEFTLSNVDGRLEHNLIWPDPLPKPDVRHSLRARGLPDKTLILEEYLFSSIATRLIHHFRTISIYDFDLKAPKKAIPMTGKAQLEEDGGNLAIVLKNILNDKDKKRKFSNLLVYLLDFIDDVRIKEFAGKFLFFTFQEKHTPNHYLPAHLMSEGTINMVALIVALYFEEKSPIIIEEPERSVHPFLIAKVADMLKEISQKKQLIITTHNPEIVKYVGLENLLLLSKNQAGFSTISKPGARAEVKIFLENEIGIDELYVQNLLEG